MHSDLSRFVQYCDICKSARLEHQISTTAVEMYGGLTNSTQPFEQFYEDLVFFSYGQLSACIVILSSILRTYFQKSDCTFGVPY